jgi:intracellular sulfur oxidation DsrE/DsrF family protein
MKMNGNAVVKRTIFFLLLGIAALPMVPNAFAGEYDNALTGVKGIDVIYDVSMGDPAFNNIVFWAVRDVYLDEAVTSLPNKSKVAVVFHGPAVKLLSSDRSGFDAKAIAEIDRFQATLREMKEEGVILEVCVYALKVLGVDPNTVMPEIDQVGNGFISVAGYQAQGYALVRLP